MKGRKHDSETATEKRVVGFQVLENECIWMKAGVISFRICDNVYDCNTCPFDKGIRRAIQEGRPLEGQAEIRPWSESLKKRHEGGSRPCRHFLTGHIDAPKICPRNYECYHCEFDQLLDEEDLVARPGQGTYHSVSGYQLADGYYYHRGHGWACFEHGGRVRIGFDDFGSALFGAPDSLKLPDLGAALKQSQPAWGFERGENSANVLAPVSGTVLVLNPRLQDEPHIIHEDPYGAGWICILEPDMPKRNLKGLYFGQESLDWMGGEVEKLHELVGSDFERLGSVRDLVGTLSTLDWALLVKTFLGN